MQHKNLDPKSRCQKQLQREGTVWSCDHCGWSITDAGLKQRKEKKNA